MKRLSGIAALILALIGLNYASSIDLQIAQDEAEQYQTNVCLGYWPNYRDITIDCN